MHERIAIMELWKKNSMKKCKICPFFHTLIDLPAIAFHIIGFATNPIGSSKKMDSSKAAHSQFLFIVLIKRWMD